MYTDNRDTEVALLKKLWRGEKVVCPKCRKDTLIHLHKKAKKSDCDWASEVQKATSIQENIPLFTLLIIFIVLFTIGVTVVHFSSNREGFAGSVEPSDQVVDDTYKQ